MVLYFLSVRLSLHVVVFGVDLLLAPKSTEQFACVVSRSCFVRVYSACVTIACALRVFVFIMTRHPLPPPLLSPAVLLVVLRVTHDVYFTFVAWWHYSTAEIRTVIWTGLAPSISVSCECPPYLTPPC